MKKIIIYLFGLLVSLPVLAQEKTDYIFHKVEPKETLYSLVKRYNTNFATVETLNPTLANGNSDIKVGQTIKFPNNKNTVSDGSALTKTSVPEKKDPTYHIVKPKETVFSISRIYNVDISSLVEANKLVSNSIKVGDKLIVDGNTLNNLATEVKREAELRLTTTGKNVKETGLAEVINTQTKSTKYLAMHRTAPIGTNIKVTNEATGHSIVAKVIGNMNEKGRDENIMIKLSPYAYYQLRPKDARLRATIEYYVTEETNENVDAK